MPQKIQSEMDDLQADWTFDVISRRERLEADRSPDTLGMYLGQIGKVRLLTAQEEVELSKAIEAGLFAEHLLATAKRLSATRRAQLSTLVELGREAKARMVRANLRLVVSVAKKSARRSGVPMLDLVQEGNLGLIRAVEKFDYKKGYKFSTYATWWIRQAMQRGTADAARVIRLPVHVHETLSKIARVRRDLDQRLGREPTLEELAEAMNEDPERLEELLGATREPISLEQPLDDGATELGHLVADVDTPSAESIVEARAFGADVRALVDTLEPREALIVSLRHGLHDGREWTLSEVGERLGLTRERIRQLERESLAKLRQSDRARSVLEWAS